MTRRLRIEAEVLDELEAPIGWYDEQRPGLGDELLEEVDATFAALERGAVASVPARPGRKRRDVRRLMLARFPYAIVFIEHDDEVRVLAVAHHRRRPGYWRHRVT